MVFVVIIFSTPAPGYFNDDDVIDFMVHWSVGAWPFYNTTDVSGPKYRSLNM